MKTTWKHFFRRMAAVSAVGTSAMLASASHYALAAANDNAGNAPYADGWQNGDNGGSGFGPWASSYTGGATPNGSKFIDNGPLAGNSLGAPAFALETTNTPYSGDTSEVTRLFSNPLAVGETFSMDVDGPALFPTGGFYDYSFVGAVLQLCSGGTCGVGNVNERFGMFTALTFNPDWTVTGGNDSNVPSANSFHLELKLVTANSFDLKLRPVGGGAPLYSLTGAPLSGPAGSAIDNLRFSLTGTGVVADGSRDLFFDNLSVVPEPGTGVLLVLGAGTFAAAALRRKRQ